MPRLRVYAFGLFVFGVFASDVPAQIYRWVDEKGTVHFTDERPSKQSGVEEVVEAGARRTPLVRGGPEWRVDTPTPASYGRVGTRDRFYDDDPPGYAPLQGDTIIQVNEPPPWWFETDVEPRDDGSKHRDDRGGHGDAGGRHRDRGRRGGDGYRNGGHGRHRDGQIRPPMAAPPPQAGQPPALAPARPRASSRAVPLVR